MATGYFMHPKRGRFDTASMVPPKFEQRLQSKEVREGECVRFTVRVTGKPPPEVTWYREGAQIVSSPDFEIQQEGNLHSLYIPEVFYEDSGKFSVGVENKGGREMCTAELIVEAPSGIEESVSPSPPVSRSPSIGASPDRHALYTPPHTIPVSGSSREASPMGPRKDLAPPKPHFTRHLQNQVAKEGERVVLTCTISPYPEPDRVQWFRNHVEIFSSPDYQVTYSSGVCNLTIAEAFPEDSGQFTCTVTIKGIPNSTLMTLTVHAGPPAPMAVSPRPNEAPIFEIQLTNQPLSYGQTAYFECQVRGYPPPEILWTRRGHPLVDKNRYKSTYDQHIGKTTLTILSARNEDEGEYTCTAINSVGERSTSALLLGPDRYQQWLREQQYAPKPITPVQEPAAMPSAVTPTRAEKPVTPLRSPASFYRPMSERALEEAAQARLSDVEPDRAPGEPSFKVSHFEKRLQEEIDFREGRAPPHVPTVEDRKAPEETVPAAQMIAPVFDQKPGNFKLMEGSDATFVCKVRGHPTPNLQWYHNGRLVRPSNRYVMNLTPDGYCSLRIRVAFPEDAGHYTCCATNMAGRDTCSAELYVEGLSQIDDTSYVAPETLRRILKSPGEGQRGPHELGGVSEKHYKPVFRKVPQDQEVPEGQMCRFDCIVSGRPQPEMLWYRDGVQVFNDNLHKIVINEDGINSLIIFATHKSDDGTYTCIARNRAGEDRFTAGLNVKPREEASMPRFVERMANQTVVEGQSAEFHAQAVGVPVPMMSWQRDGRHITPSNKYHIETEGSSSSLFIPILSPEDTAWYQCTAANVAGTATNRARLIVQVEARRPEPERKLVIPTPRKTTPTPPPVAPSAPSPTFVSCFTPPPIAPAQPIRPPTPEIKQTFRGRDVVSPTMERPVSAPAKPPTPEPMKSRADIVLSPTPPPKTPEPLPWKAVKAPTDKAAPAHEPMEVQPPWMQPEVQQPVRVPPPPKAAPVPAPVKAEPVRPVQMRPAPPPAAAAPAVPYMPKESPLLKYIQEDEHAPKDATDMVEPPRPITVKAVARPEPEAGDMFSAEQQRPPKFKRQLKPLVTLTETQPAHYESFLVPIGDPNMKVEWFKDDQLLRAGHRFRPINDFGYVALDILYTYPEDNGIYMCRATNKYGTDTVQAELKCTGKESVITDTQLPEGAEHLHAMEESWRRANLPREQQEEQPAATAPVFDLLPEAVQVEEGDSAKFMIKIGGHPRPRLTWWINGAMVVTGQRFRLRYDGMIHILEIPKVREYDQGTIRVAAKNPLGEAECSSTLTVIPREDWRSRLKQTPKSTVEVELKKKKVPTATLR